jgi:C2 domain-containing protein 3
MHFDKVLCSLFAAVPTMKAFRTATTLCIADPTFHDVTRHRILLPQGTPVQRELLTGKFEKRFL